MQSPVPTFLCLDKNHEARQLPGLLWGGARAPTSIIVLFLQPHSACSTFLMKGGFRFLVKGGKFFSLLF